MQNLVWRVKLVAETGDGPDTEIELARIEREDWAVPETLGLSLREGKKITAAIQFETVRIQATTMRRTLSILPVLWIDGVQQGISERYFSIPVRRRAAPYSTL